VIAAAITSRINKNRLPTHIEVDAQSYGLARDSIVLLEQIRTLDKRRLKERMGHLDREAMEKVDRAISISFGLDLTPASSREQNL
jgi:mRNA interferase MazF